MAEGTALPAPIMANFLKDNRDITIDLEDFKDEFELYTHIEKYLKGNLLFQKICERQEAERPEILSRIEKLEKKLKELRRPILPDSVEVVAIDSDDPDDDDVIFVSQEAPKGIVVEQPRSLKYSHYKAAVDLLPKPPMLRLGCKVYAQRPNEVWYPGTLIQITQNGSDLAYHVQFDRKGDVGIFTGKQIAPYVGVDYPLPIGTRVIAVYLVAGNPCPNYYAGIVAETVSNANVYRYLVFFDDGYAQYVKPLELLRVLVQSRNVWDDVHVSARNFIQQYLMSYPERPMLRLQVGQVIKAELQKEWFNARVVAVDCSLVHMHFVAAHKMEWLYRGSLRLAPLYQEMANVAKLQSIGKRRSFGVTKSKQGPCVEYPRLTEILASPEKKRAVAKKSTAGRSVSHQLDQIDNHLKHQRKQVMHEEQESRENVQDLLFPVHSLPRVTFIVHTCSPQCISEYEKRIPKGMNNPLYLPVLCGWERQIGKARWGKKALLYRSPCGRRLRNLFELSTYLLTVSSQLSIDLFSFDVGLRTTVEFKPAHMFCNIKDLSYGREEVKISCVNGIDHDYPDYMDYSNERQPIEGVNIPTDEDFLTACNCTDDCMDRSKCECIRNTIEGTAIIGGHVKDDAGYQFRRLTEMVQTGIYECNSRCKCARTCHNRVVQNPLKNRLQVYKTEKRGWGLRCLDDLPAGALVCVYVGKILDEKTSTEEGKTFGDEYFAELDLIEAIEKCKEGYESEAEEFDNDVQKCDEDKNGHLDGLDDEKDNLNDEDFVLGSNKRRKKNKKTEQSKKKESSEEKLKNDDCAKVAEESKKSEESLVLSDNTSQDDSVLVAPFSDDQDKSEEEPSSMRRLWGEDERVYVIDAKKSGNVGRYLNHSCSPNVFVQSVFVDTHDLRFPWVSFFAFNFIPAGTELTWDYSYEVGAVPNKVLYCYCGSEDCRGRLL